MPTFRTSFSTPTALTTVTATPNAGSSSVDIAWSTPAIAGSEFWRYAIYRRISGVSNWELIGSVYDINDLTYTDAEAPHGVSLEYSVRLDNGWAQSSDTRATGVVLDLDYWIIDPSDPSLTFELRYVQPGGYTAQEEAQQERFAPLGRSFPLVVSGERLAPSGSIRALVLAGDRGLIDLLRRAADVDPWVILKDPFGAVMRVTLGTIDREYIAAGAVNLGITYQQVA